MGIYASYYLGRKDGIESIVFENLPKLIECLDNCKLNFPEDYNESIHKMSIHMNNVGPSSLDVSTEEEATLIDRVVSELLLYDTLGLITGIEDSLIQWIEVPIMKRYRYAHDLKSILPNSSGYARELYRRILFEGMSMANRGGSVYKLNNDLDTISWLLPHEIERFMPELSTIIEKPNFDNDEEVGIYIIHSAMSKAQEENCALIVTIG
ncbi:hypothetical protein [Hahella sp. HN01]|uniref:hypothetical protein n=1 Tax=Hahella sp. HN01 TaxID=2847262 RepID=UPI001C1EE49E|nr:hypothetical protein [Hahella sp. HN01]MBU6953187.1 hypothetical protein [Hahella sp. HN01]